jgi:hypothetical protein
MDGELIKTARRAILAAVHNEGVPGLLGKADGTLSYVDPQGTRHADRAWARIGHGDAQQEIVVRLAGVAKWPNMPVMIADRNGTPTAIRADTERASPFVGERVVDVAAHSWMHGRLAPDPHYVEGLLFLPFLVRPTDPASMAVRVEAGWYRAAGTLRSFAGATSASMAAYVPGISYSQHFVIIAHDQTANAVVVVDGTSKFAAGGASPFTAADVEAVAVPPGYLPLAAVRFYSGQTTIQPQDIIFDLRPWGSLGGAGGSSGSGAGGGWVVDYNAIIPADRWAFIPGGVAVLDGTTLTVDGELYAI